MEKLQQQMNIIERQMAEQALLRQKLQQLTNLESTRVQKTEQYKLPTNQFQIEEQGADRSNGSQETSLGQTSNQAVEEIIRRRREEFQRSQAEKAEQFRFLTQRREQILNARDRLKEKCDMFRSLPSPVERTEVVMKPARKGMPNNQGESYVHKLVSGFSGSLDRIWTLKESLHEDYVTKRKPYSGELGIDSYQPWQIPDFLLVRRLVEEFVDDFLVKKVPPEYVIFERENKLKRHDLKQKGWDEASKALTERAVVKLVAEEILLEATAQMTRDVASEGVNQDAMFRLMSANMFIKEAEIQATSNQGGRHPGDPVYDEITHLFNSLQRGRDQRKKGVWVHTQALAQPAVPPPLPLVSKSSSGAIKLARKASEKPNKTADEKNKWDMFIRKGTFEPGHTSWKVNLNDQWHSLRKMVNQQWHSSRKMVNQQWHSS